MSLWIKKYFRVLFLAGFFLVLPVTTLATSSIDSVTGGLNVTAEAGGLGGEAPDIFPVISRAIEFIIGLFGILIMLMTVYSGFLYITSQGDKEKAAKAQKIITYTIIGAVVILASYALANFVLGALTTIYEG